MKIANKPLGKEHPVLVIAEIGVNHDGSVDRALELVDVAAKAGADAIKLQIFRAQNLMHDSSAFAAYQQNTCQDAHPSEMLRRYELPKDDLQRVIAYARSKNLLAIATPFSLQDIPLIQQLHLDAVKIASPDLVNLPLLRAAMATHKPLLISTGAATMDEIETTASWMGNRPYALLHCISSYPTPSGDANLCWIEELLSRFHVPVGYSDHTTEVYAGALAVAAGACVIEKHLTYDCAAAGPDHAASADPKMFSEYVRLIRSAEQFRGTRGKHVLPIEQDVRRVSRQSLVLSRDLPAGAIITSDDLTVQRPGIGIPVALIDQVIGRQMDQSAPAGTMLTWNMISSPALSAAVQ